MTTLQLSKRPAALRAPGAVPQIIAVAVAGLACALAVVPRRILPERFLLDDGHIQQTIRSPFAGAETQSFRNVAAMYRSLGLGDRPGLAALLTILLFTAAVFAAARWPELARFGVLGMFVFCLGFACALAYLAQYSKESLSVLVILVLLLLPRHPASDVFFVALCLAYGALVRPYWVIVAALYLLWRVLLPRVRNPLWLLVVVVACYALLAVVFVAFLGEPLSAAREEVNSGRSATDVGSLIVAPIPIEGAAAGPAAAVMLLALLLPLPLLFSGGLFHLASGVVIAALWSIAVAGAVRMRRAPGAPDATGRAVRAARASAMLLAFVSVQAVFEPDFGSYLKHLTPLLPLFLTLVPLRKPEALS